MGRKTPPGLPKEGTPSFQSSTYGYPALTPIKPMLVPAEQACNDLRDPCGFSGTKPPNSRGFDEENNVGIPGIDYALSKWPLRIDSGLSPFISIDTYLVSRSGI